MNGRGPDLEERGEAAAEQPEEAPGEASVGSQREAAPTEATRQREDAPGEAAAEQPEEAPGRDSDRLVNVLEALLFLAEDPVPRSDLASATESSEAEIAAAVEALKARQGKGGSGLRLRELGGGLVLATAPEHEQAAKRLFSKPRVATLTPAQLETLSIVAYLQPVSRPEMSKIRGVSADSATAALLERGLIEEAGRSEFGATLYETTTKFLKLFGLSSIESLPDLAQWDPSPQEEEELRQRLLAAGEARADGGGRS